MIVKTGYVWIWAKLRTGDQRRKDVWLVGCLRHRPWWVVWKCCRKNNFLLYLKEFLSHFRTQRNQNHGGSGLNMHFTCRPPDGDSCWCKKTSGPRKVYGRTAFCLDLCKHFSSELMDSVTNSGSYWIKKTESLGDYMFQKAAHWLTTCQSLVIRQ